MRNRPWLHQKVQNTVFDHPSDILFALSLNFQKTLDFFLSNALNLNALNLKY